MKKKEIATAGYVLGGLPLIFYPGVIVADIMALAGSGGHISGFMPRNLNEALMLFAVIGATIYPLLWLGCVWASNRAFKRGKEASALKTGVFPVFFALSLALVIWLQ